MIGGFLAMTTSNAPFPSYEDGRTGFFIVYPAALRNDEEARVTGAYLRLSTVEDIIALRTQLETIISDLETSLQQVDADTSQHRAKIHFIERNAVLSDVDGSLGILDSSRVNSWKEIRLFISTLEPEYRATQPVGSVLIRRCKVWYCFDVKEVDELLRQLGLMKDILCGRLERLKRICDYLNARQRYFAEWPTLGSATMDGETIIVIHLFTDFNWIQMDYGQPLTRYLRDRSAEE
jgi:hypothetical protein